MRSWFFRGTLHVVAADDVRWLLELLGPVFARASSSRRAQLGLDEDLTARGTAEIRRALTNAGPLTRSELVDRLAARGIRLDRQTQAPIHLIRLAALQGILCLGPLRADGDTTYVLLDDWVPRAAAGRREAALAELARRYFTAFGPATVEDLAAFTGLSMSDAGTAVRGARKELTEVTIAGMPGWLTRRAARRPIPPRRPQVRLLPAFDTYLLGYRRRDFAVPPPLQRRLQRGGGWLHPVLVVNGRAVAAWTLRRSGTPGDVIVEAMQPITGAVLAGLEAEVADLGRFLNRQMALCLSGS